MGCFENDLQTKGYMHYQAATPCSQEDKGFLLDEVRGLEKDPYAPENTIRHRRYGNAIILPWKNNELHWLPTKIQGGKQFSGYDQGSNNPEHDSIRYFNALSPQLKSTEFMNQLVIEDFEKTFGLNDHYLPVYVGVHIVKVICKDNEKLGFSSPDCFHQDGEPFTFAHLISRSENALGGRNYIADIESRNKTLSQVNNNNINLR